MLRSTPLLTAFSLVLVATAPVAQETAPKPLTFRDLMSGRARYRVESPRASWHSDGKLLRVTIPGGKRKTEPLRDPRTWEVVKPTKPATPAAARKPKTHAAIDGDKVVFHAGTEKPKAIVTDKAAKREPHVSPDAKRVSFVRENNLVVFDVDAGTEWSITSDGSPEMFHGVLDWVYQEEIYGRYDFQGHWWSPDSKRVAFLSLDESPVREFTVIDHAPTRKLADERAVVSEISNYPKAGDPNPIVSLSIASLDGRKVVPVDLSRYPDDMLVVRIGWTPDGSKVVYQVQDRIQTWLEVGYADPETGEATTLIREESPTWVNVLGTPRWLDDGTFLWWSERTGKKNLYHYKADGELLARVTPTDFPVRDIVRLDEENGLLWFTGSPDFAADEHAFRVGLDGKGLVQLTEGRGTHRVALNHDGSTFVDTYSAVDRLPEVRVCDRDGEVLRTIESVKPKWSMPFCPTELHTVTARDGFQLDATVTKPLGFDEKGGPYPVWIETYSGPEAPSVYNRHRISGWQQFLAHQGIIVLQVNVRTASKAGQDVVGKCYQQFCVQELQDLEDTIDWLCANPWADASRVGMTGWSYGGTITAYALTHSKKFRVGIAGAGVYDWQLYDTIYTERYMNTPQANPKGYAKSSVIDAAKDLHGYLVLVHGTMDDNVHLQNSIRLAGALQDAGKDFEMMLYPNSRHGVRKPARARHLMQLRWKIIQRELLGS